MKRKIPLLLFTLTFLVASSFTAGSAVSSQDRYLVDSGGNFTWTLELDREVQGIEEVVTPAGVKLLNNRTEENKLSMTFEVSEDIEKGPQAVGVFITLPGTTKYYYASVGVGLTSDEELEESVSTLQENINETREELRQELNSSTEALKERLSDLENRTQTLEQELEQTKDELQSLREECGDENTFGITGSFPEEGSILAGLAILVFLAAYITYKKLKEEESEEEEEIEIEEKPKDFSP